MKIRFITFLAVLVMIIMNFTLPADIYITKTGFVKFTSDAPLESIEAENIEA